MTYLVDTDWLIDALAGNASTVRALDQLRGDGLGVSIISAAELYEGAFGVADPFPRLNSYRHFLGAFVNIPVTQPIAERFGELRTTLRSEGNLIPDLDLLIAATALEHQLTLLTRNLRHFQRVPGLRVY